MKNVADPCSEKAVALVQAPTKQNDAGTRKRLLAAAIDEFCRHGRTGASTARIVTAAKCNIRMIYHYFGNKDGLYQAALLDVYSALRDAEERQDFWSLSAREGVVRLTQFTFDYMYANPDFPKMIMVENLAGGRTVSTTEEPFYGSRTLMTNLEALIEKGYASGEFRSRPSALDLYLTILGLSFIHISNRYTLAATFGVNLSTAEFIEARRAQVVDAVLAYLT